MRALSLVLLLLTVGACSQDADRGAAERAEPARYTVRGQLDVIGDGELFVFHEAIPEFVGHSGEVVGMDSMQMPFALGDRVSIEGLEPGDKVEMTVAVDFGAKEPMRVLAIEELPPGTVLELTR